MNRFCDVSIDLFGAHVRPGDVIVFVSDTCVLGYSHQDVICMFQAIAPDESAVLRICRGYRLPFDPDDPDTEIITTVAVTSPQDCRKSSLLCVNGGDNGTELPVPDMAAHSVGSSAETGHPFNVSHEKPPTACGRVRITDELSGIGRPEMLHMLIARGPMGFGFTIADSPCGQKVRSSRVGLCFGVCVKFSLYWDDVIWRVFVYQSE